MAAYPLDFVIHTGDLVYQTSENASTAEAFALKYYRPFSPILHHTPVYAVPGNHEYAKDACVDNQPFYFDVFAPLADLDQGDQPVTGKRQYYAIVYQNIQFLFLDSQVFFGEEGKQEQEDWLKERLQDDRFIYSVVIFHIPPFTSSLIHPKDSLPVRQDLQPLFAAARVPLVLSGHSHNYERLNVDGTTYIVSGGGSGELYPAGKHDPHSQVFSMSSHFVLLELYSDHISITAIDTDGEIIDQSTVLISKK